MVQKDRFYTKFLEKSIKYFLLLTIYSDAKIIYNQKKNG